MNTTADMMGQGHAEDRVDIATMLDWLTRDAKAESLEDNAVVRLSYRVGIAVVIFLLLLGAASMRA